MPPIEMAGSRHKISRGVPVIELTLFKLRLRRKGVLRMNCHSR